MKQRFSVLTTCVVSAFLLLMATATTSFSAFSGSDDVTVQEVIAKHGDSIGTAEMPFREGLMEGALSAAWPLLDLATRKASLKYDGNKKLDGRKVHVLRYEAKNDYGLKTKLYFDAETFRHVRTEYEQRIVQQMANQPGFTFQNIWRQGLRFEFEMESGSHLKLFTSPTRFKTQPGLTISSRVGQSPML